MKAIRFGLFTVLLLFPAVVQAQAQTPIEVTGDGAIKVALFDVADITKYIYKHSNSPGGPYDMTKEVSPPTDTLLFKDFVVLDQGGLHYVIVEAHDSGGLKRASMELAYDRKTETVCVYTVVGGKLGELLGCVPWTVPSPAPGQ